MSVSPDARVDYLDRVHQRAASSMRRRTLRTKNSQARAINDALSNGYTMDQVGQALRAGWEDVYSQKAVKHQQPS